MGPLKLRSESTPMQSLSYKAPLPRKRRFRPKGAFSITPVGRPCTTSSSPCCLCCPWRCRTSIWACVQSPDIRSMNLVRIGMNGLPGQPAPSGPASPKVVPFHAVTVVQLYSGLCWTFSPALIPIPISSPRTHLLDKTLLFARDRSEPDFKIEIAERFSDHGTGSIARSLGITGGNL